MNATTDGTSRDAPEHDADDENDELVELAPAVPLRAIFRHFWPHTRDFRWRMILSLLLTGAVPAISTASIYLYKVLVDDVLTPHDFRLFPMIAALYLILTVTEGVVSWVDEVLTAWVGERFVLNLRVELFSHLQRLSLGFFERRQLGDVMSRLGGDVSEIETLVLTGVNMALTYAFQILLFTGMLFYLDWRLALAAFVAAPGFLLVARVLSRRIQTSARELRRRSGSISAVAEESLSNLALVQAYDRQTDETARYRRENQGAFSAQMVATRLEALFGPLSNVVEVVGVLLVMGFAVWELANGRVTLGELLVFVAYLSQLYGPVAGFGGLWNEMSSAKAGAERIIEMLDQEPAVVDRAEPMPLHRAAGTLALQQVTFTYPDTERPALSGIDLRITRARRSRWSGPVGRARPRSPSCCCASTTPTRGASPSTDTTSATSGCPTSVATSPPCCRRPSSSTARSPTTSAGDGPTPRTRRSSRPPAPRTSTGSSRTCPTGTPRGSGSAVACCRAASGSGSPLRGR